MEVSVKSAIEYLFDNVKSESLRGHCLNVGKLLRYYAEKLKSEEITTSNFTKKDISTINPEYWQIAGILHDTDWESDPDKHPAITVSYLESINFPNEITHAINSHADLSWLAKAELKNEVIINNKTVFRSIPRVSILDKFLFACDELSGFVVAVGKVRPNGISDIEPKSVIKRLKDLNFAAGVSRNDIYMSIDEIGISLQDHVQNVINGLNSSL